ncbi:SHOCT domain-containing protein [Haloactinomyces albus]|uniref:SHOCT domain-containing protein n=1 Tax=Haloactinomyces albus TaxID=1352928 RepID=A0AAE4CMU4_9ACTN|nr:SHOCT domain-containing protein [Haloactinomyces albus]MDR7302786.1 hypothetical protein [Haloactinomyces albus]
MATLALGVGGEGSGRVGEEEYPTYPGLAQAAARLKNVFGGKRDIRRLPKYLYSDETVGELAIGLCGGDFGVLALTDRRVLYVYEGWVDSRSEDFPFDQVEGVHLQDKGRERSEIESVNKADARRFIDAARKKLNRARKHSPKPNRTGPEAPARPAPPAQQGSGSSTESDPLDRLERLGKLRDAGVLTEEEFATQKAKLLHRL